MGKGPQPPVDVSRFSTEDLLSALNFLQQQRAMGGAGPGLDPQQQAALQQLQQQQQQQAGDPHQQQQGGGTRHHDPYRQGR
mmetsp:Transcript_17750/g.55066  ORF Transcript_17750/g.55066 Transcript_17750/m.55066 type:complete len:81 (+) Transcript_17750:34-276(+)